MHNERGLDRGKDFEEVVRKAFESVPETLVERLPDPVQGYLGIRNKCDFIIYHFPYQYYIECKTTQSHRLPFANITFNQWQGMLKVVDTFGVIAGVIVWYVKEDKTLFIPIQVLEAMKQAGKKSAILDDAEWSDKFIEIEGKKKRIFFDYDVVKFLTDMQNARFGERGIHEH